MAIIFCSSDKHSTLCHEQLANMGVLTINKDVRTKEDLLRMPAVDIWHDLTSKLQCETLCVKPARDGCSTGVARLWYATFFFFVIFWCQSHGALEFILTTCAYIDILCTFLI